MSMPWFRLYRELKDDPKIGVLDDASFRLFIESLCWACEIGKEGNTRLTRINADWAFRRDVTSAVTVTGKSPLQSLFDAGLLAENEQREIVVTKWQKRQFESDSSAERVRKHRVKLAVTASTPLLKRKCNGTDTDTDTDTDTEAEAEAEAEALPKEMYCPASRVALHWLNEKSGKSFRECESSLAPINARMKESGVDLEGVKKMIERQCALWNGGVYQEYLRPQTLFGKEKFDGYYAAKDQPVATPTATKAKFNPYAPMGQTNMRDENGNLIKPW